MSIESVKFHTSQTASDARAIIELLESVDVAYKVVAADSYEEVSSVFSNEGFEPVDVYIHTDDLHKADKALRPMLVG